jgi:hypothetical protein
MGLFVRTLKVAKHAYSLRRNVLRRANSDLCSLPRYLDRCFDFYLSTAFALATALDIDSIPRSEPVIHVDDGPSLLAQSQIDMIDFTSTSWTYHSGEFEDI